MGHALPVGLFRVEVEDCAPPDSQTARCRALWAAVLGQAIAEYRQGRSRVIAAWITDGSVRPCSFAWICRALGLPEQAARERLLAEVPESRWAKRRRGRRPKLRPVRASEVSPARLELRA